ncbi:unnamed protein product [Vitrella brassicaformis CCMP3155]|uniref:Uncharacterized protein n=1 Tax=Vitrella brassicaformis (strain CCMP3155) TaxID=1169540 RepID=A0A0G4ESX0_VITBC|nr:unnamed protein product [Vitrella brassicaformis CCMP3155]|eukprot:CEM01748.1 unnamed protein product [Vitrella brassicaformis CCMP3155]
MRLINVVTRSSLADAPAIVHALLARMGSEEALRGDPCPLRDAIICGKYDIAHIMLNYIMDSSVDDPSSELAQLKLLFDVERHNPGMHSIVKLSMVSRLVELGPDQLRQRDANRRLPIHEFCLYPLRTNATQEVLIDLLVRRGSTSTLNTTDTTGATPLQLASLANADGLLRGLLKNGVDLRMARVPYGSWMGRDGWMQRAVEAHLDYIRQDLPDLIMRCINRSMRPLRSLRAVSRGGFFQMLQVPGLIAEIARYACSPIPLRLPATLRQRIERVMKLFVEEAIAMTLRAEPGARVNVLSTRFTLTSLGMWGAMREEAPRVKSGFGARMRLKEVVEMAVREEAARWGETVPVQLPWSRLQVDRSWWRGMW